MVDVHRSGHDSHRDGVAAEVHAQIKDVITRPKPGSPEYQMVEAVYKIVDAYADFDTAVRSRTLDHLVLKIPTLLHPEQVKAELLARFKASSTRDFGAQLNAWWFNTLERPVEEGQAIHRDLLSIAEGRAVDQRSLLSRMRVGRPSPQDYISALRNALYVDGKLEQMYRLNEFAQSDPLLSGEGVR